MNLRPKFLLGLLAASFLGVLYLVDPTGFELLSSASAQGAGGAVFDDILNEFNSKWSIFVELGMVVSFVIYPIVSLLLDPQFFLDVTSGGSNQLLIIWQLSRDIMNTIFAFMLVGGAMMTVVMAKEDYLKKYALKFVVGVILVNFSWFFPCVILDVSNILTANIYQIPNVVGTVCQYREADGSLRSCEFPIRYEYFPDEDFVRNSTANGWKCISTFICYEPEELDNTTNTAGGVLAGLMLNHARLGELNKVMVNRRAAAGDSLYKTQLLISQIVHVGLQLLLVLYITIILVGMAVALLVRIPILWMTMAFMPLMFLGFVVGDLLPEKMNTMNLIFKKFVHAAFLPAAMAIPLAVGFILVNALAFSPPSSAPAFMTNASGFILPGISTLWEFLWLLIAIIIMWKGFKTALSVDEIFENATSSITSFGDNLGTIVKNSPLNVPFIPAPGGGAKTLGQATADIGSLANASRTGNIMPRLQQIRTGQGGSSSINTANITISNNLRNTISSALTNGLNQPEIQKIAAELKRLNPAASTDSLVEKMRDEIKESGDPLGTNQAELDKKLQEIRQALEEIT